MGMYTEIIFGAGLKSNLSSDIITNIQNLVDGVDISNPPNHPFFQSERSWLLRSDGSYYFPGTVAPTFWYDEISKQYYLHFRTNIKNYNGEIEKFLDWIKPYIEDGVGTDNFYAIVTYEECSEPTIYYLNKD